MDLPGCNYRKLKKFDDEVLWNNIKEGVDENGKENGHRRRRARLIQETVMCFVSACRFRKDCCFS